MAAPAVAAVRRPSTHWICGESHLLRKCYRNVSEEEGGLGADQPIKGLWDKVIVRYLASNPPTPMNKRGIATSVVRDKRALVNKWTQTNPLISHHMKCEVHAFNNIASGESRAQTVRIYSLLSLASVPNLRWTLESILLSSHVHPLV